MEALQEVDVAMLGRPTGLIEKNIEKVLKQKIVSFEDRLRTMLGIDNINLNISNIELTQPPEVSSHSPSIASEAETGTVSILLEKRTLMWATDCYYDSANNRADNKKSAELTTSDFRIQERILNSFLTTAFSSANWALEAASRYRELSGLGAIASIEVVHQKFNGLITIVFHEDFIEAINRLNSPVDEQLNEKLIDAAKHIPITLNAQLWRDNIPLSTLRALKVGDELPISVYDDVPVLIGTNPLFSGNISDQNGRLILKLTKANDESVSI